MRRESELSDNENTSKLMIIERFKNEDDTLREEEFFKDTKIKTTRDVAALPAGPLRFYVCSNVMLVQRIEKIEKKIEKKKKTKK